MRSLSESTKKINVTKKEDENKLLDTLNNLQTRMDQADAAISDLQNEVNSQTLDKDLVTADVLNATTANAGNINATNASIDEAYISHLDSDLTEAVEVRSHKVIASEKTTSPVFEGNEATIGDLTVTGTASIANIEFGDLSAEDITADDIVSQSISNENTTTTKDLVVTDGATLNEMTANEATITEADISEADISDANITDSKITNIDDNVVLQNRYIIFDKNYVDINQVVSETDFVVIEVPIFSAGDYRLLYANPVTNEIYFSMVINNTYDNCYFSYYKGEDPKYLDQVAIKDMKLYIKTWVAGRLYYHSDSFNTKLPTNSYGDWPIDLNTLDYPLFNATRRRATVYTNYVNIGMNDAEFGSGVLSLYNTDDYNRVATYDNPAEYDPNNDKIAYFYLPDQSVNIGDNVKFGWVEANVVKGDDFIDTYIQDNQYLIKRNGTTELTRESPVDNTVDETLLNRTGDHLITERSIANWNGQTNRQYTPPPVHQEWTSNNIVGFTEGSSGTTADKVVTLSDNIQYAWRGDDSHIPTSSDSLDDVVADTNTSYIAPVYRDNIPESYDMVLKSVSAINYFIGVYRPIYDNNNNVAYFVDPALPEIPYSIDSSVMIQNIIDAYNTAGISNIFVAFVTNIYSGWFMCTACFGEDDIGEIKASIENDNNHVFTENVDITDRWSTTSSVKTFYYDDFYVSDLVYKVNGGTQPDVDPDIGNNYTIIPTNAEQVTKNRTEFTYETPYIPAQYSSSITHVGKIEEGEWDAGDVVAPNIAATNNLYVDNDVDIIGDVAIGGDLNVAGTITTVHSEEVTTKENTIELREGATTGLVPGDVSGLIINNYDGDNSDSGILLDSEGTLRIGDLNSLEPVATRAESANMTDGNIIEWDATNLKLVDAGVSVSDLQDSITEVGKTLELTGWDEYLDKVVGTGGTAPAGMTDVITQIAAYMTANEYTALFFKAASSASQVTTYLGDTTTYPKVFEYIVDKSTGTTVQMASLTISALSHISGTSQFAASQYDFTNNVWLPIRTTYGLTVSPDAAAGTINTSGATTAENILRVGAKNSIHIEIGKASSLVTEICSKDGNDIKGGILDLAATSVRIPSGTNLIIPKTAPTTPSQGMIWVY